MRKCSLALLTLVAVYSLPMRAQENEVELATFMSRYMWRGIRLSDGPVYQASVTTTAKGFFLNVWGNVDFNQKKLNETDLTISYSREIGKLTFESGLIHYGIFEDADNDEIYSGILLSNHPLQPSIQVNFDVRQGKGAYIQGSVGHTFALRPHWDLQLTANLGIVLRDGYLGVRDDGREFSGLHNGEVNAALPIEVSKHWVLRFQIGVTTPLSKDARQAIRNASLWDSASGSFNGTTVYGGGTLSYSF
jgi:uncharacterized protein (TIGR02001 family)